MEEISGSFGLTSQFTPAIAASEYPCVSQGNDLSVQYNGTLSLTILFSTDGISRGANWVHCYSFPVVSESEVDTAINFTLNANDPQFAGDGLVQSGGRYWWPNGTYQFQAGWLAPYFECMACEDGGGTYLGALTQISCLGYDADAGGPPWYSPPVTTWAIPPNSTDAGGAPFASGTCEYCNGVPVPGHCAAAMGSVPFSNWDTGENVANSNGTLCALPE